MRSSNINFETREGCLLLLSCCVLSQLVFHVFAVLCHSHIKPLNVLFCEGLTVFFCFFLFTSSNFVFVIYQDVFEKHGCSTLKSTVLL